MPCPSSCQKLGLDLAEIFREAGKPLVLLACCEIELMAARSQVGERAGQFAKPCFGRRQNGVGFGHALVDLRALAGTRLQLAFENILLGGQPLERPIGILGELPLTFDIFS